MQSYLNHIFLLVIEAHKLFLFTIIYLIVITNIFFFWGRIGLSELSISYVCLILLRWILKKYINKKQINRVHKQNGFNPYN